MTIRDEHIAEPGLVVVDVTVADDDTALAFQARCGAAIRAEVEISPHVDPCPSGGSAEGGTGARLRRRSPPPGPMNAVTTSGTRSSLTLSSAFEHNRYNPTCLHM
ncbi:DUF6207 family protein [Streptomyces mirabilis]|uniref:DUF6207 family protein n=1 Tax=Streptomyces mirabilis TaxID=68239 RepID=UPI0022559135|nr:DUF6207 family protein [Streptomyces mirabilis]MCX4429749.1 DUF6207 family protein [Streptomyces mirabilis]